MEHTYKIVFKIGDLFFEVESTDLKWLEKKEKEYLRRLDVGKLKRIEPLLKSKQEQEPSVSPGITINEFFRKYIQKKQIKPRTTIAVFFIYYLQKLGKKKAIKTDDIKQCFQQVSYPNWNKINIADTLQKAKRRALLNYVNKLWTLTTTGEDFVLNTISGKVK